MLKKQRAENVDDDSSSSGEDVMVSYKSKRSAMPAGSSDQNATATLVNILKINTDSMNKLLLSGNRN